MSKKRALIVDDSKSARVVLGRMLQKYDIEVDTAESAELALEYLKQNRPDVIFMDHLMPGMDGFQAVQAIKSNPLTATIPIMMYTSQQGELYVGQARALGAVGVLPKLIKPVDVSKVLYQLRLLPDRRDAARAAFVEAEVEILDDGKSAPPLASGGFVPADWQPQLQTALREHDAELRRFVGTSLDGLAGRVTEEVRNIVINEAAALQAMPGRTSPYMWIAAIALALLPGIVLGVFYMRSVENNRELAAAVSRLEQSNAQLAGAVKRLAARDSLQAASTSAATSGSGSQTLPPGAIPVDTALVETVPYGEVPLALSRVETLRELLSRLRGQSFHGKLRIEAFKGQFCLSGSAKDGYTLAPANLPAGECDLIGNPPADGLSAPQRESLAFANLASSVQQRVQGLSVDVVVDGERLVAPYPPPTENVTAGEWNAIAARNNRVEFRAIPAAPSSPPPAS